MQAKLGTQIRTQTLDPGAQGCIDQRLDLALLQVAHARRARQRCNPGLNLRIGRADHLPRLCFTQVSLQAPLSLIGKIVKAGEDFRLMLRQVFCKAFRRLEDRAELDGQDGRGARNAVDDRVVPHRPGPQPPDRLQVFLGELPGVDFADHRLQAVNVQNLDWKVCLGFAGGETQLPNDFGIARPREAVQVHAAQGRLCVRHRHVLASRCAAAKCAGPITNGRVAMPFCFLLRTS